MKKKRLLTARGELMENPLSWEQQEVFRLLKSQPGTMYQEADETGRKYFRDWVRGVLEVTEITVTQNTSLFTCAVTADDTNDALSIAVTNSSANTIKCLATVDIYQITKG